MMISLEILIYIVVAVALALLVGFLWFLFRERIQLPLKNETDLGIWLIPLLEDVEEGRLTTARRTFDLGFETAIMNCDDQERAKELQGLRKEVLKYNLFAFKGSSKYILYSNANLIDEKLSVPLGPEKRLLKSPNAIVNRGVHDGFQIVFLQMPDADAVHMKPEEREVHATYGEALRFIRSAALNLEKVSETNKELRAVKDELDLTRKRMAKMRSERDEAKTAGAIFSLSGEEKPKMPGSLRAKLSEFFYSGWRILGSLVAGGVTYFIAQGANLTFDPVIPSLVAGGVTFAVYPWVAKRL